jgi:hypothetical protein
LSRNTKNFLAFLNLFLAVSTKTIYRIICYVLFVVFYGHFGLVYTVYSHISINR